MHLFGRHRNKAEGDTRVARAKGLARAADNEAGVRAQQTLRNERNVVGSWLHLASSGKLAM